MTQTITSIYRIGGFEPSPNDVRERIFEEIAREIVSLAKEEYKGQVAERYKRVPEELPLNHFAHYNPSKLVIISNMDMLQLKYSDAYLADRVLYESIYRTIRREEGVSLIEKVASILSKKTKQSDYELMKMVKLL